MNAGRDQNGKFIKGSKINQGRIPSVEQRRKQSEAMKGRIETQEHKEKIRAGILRAKSSGRSIGHPKKMTTWNKGIAIDISHLHTEEVAHKISKALMGKSPSLETRQKLSAIVKKWWTDPDNARKALVFNSPNKEEIKLQEILNFMYPGEWKFVGNGQIVIDGKCPDFININGQKKIIELYGERWHQNDDPQERINLFKPFGYETLVIWVRELRNLDRVRESIKTFCEGRK